MIHTAFFRWCALAVVAVSGLFLAVPQPAHAGSAQPYMVCTDAPWAPFQMTSQQGVFGFDIDVMRAIAAIEGFDIKIKDMVFDAIIPSLRHGACDIGASSFSISNQRQRLVDFSSPYYVTNQALLVRKANQSSVFGILTGRGKTGLVGATRGSSAAQWIQMQLIGQGYDVERKLYKGYSWAIKALFSGQVDAVIEDVDAAQAAVARHADQLMIAGLIKSHEYYGFPVPPGDPYDLLPRLNKGMAKLGLQVVETDGGRTLDVQPGTPWAQLAAVYFGSNMQSIAVAWRQCGQLIRRAGSLDDVRNYTQCMAKTVAAKP